MRTISNMTRIHPLWPTLAVALSLFFAFVGERILSGSDHGRIVLASTAAIAIVAAASMRLRELRLATEEKRCVAKILFGCTLGVLAGLLLYALIPLAFSAESAKTPRAILWGIWPVVLASSAVPLFAVEIATVSSAYIAHYELGRIRRAFDRGLALGLFAAVVFLANFLANRHDVKWDLSYGQKANASEQTQRAVRDLTEDVKVTLFFPRANEVAEVLDPYFDSVAHLSPHIQVQRVDHALASLAAKETGVTENGYVSVSHDKSHEKIRVGDKMTSARSALRKFDSSFLGAVLKVTREKKVAYFTTGHEERSASPGPNDARSPTKLLKQLLETNQYTIKQLGIAEGLAQKLPDDASMVFIMGPEKPFSASEIEAVNKALDRGVRLFIALEAEREGENLAGILGPLGLKFDKTLLANERTNVPFTHSEADRAFIWSNRYSSHESVTTMTRNEKLATVFEKTGSLAKNDEKKPPDRSKIELVLTALDDTFADTNNNLVFDRDSEKKLSYGLAAAVTRTSTSGKKSEEMRVFVVADVDVFADELIKFEGNVRLLADIVYWLRNVEEPVVPAVSEADVQIVHRKEEDTLWFYSTTLGFPALVLVLGEASVRRRRRRT